MPLQRLGRTEEHAWLVALLASPLGPVFSESVVTLDGPATTGSAAGRRGGMAEPGGSVPQEQRRSPPVT